MASLREQGAINDRYGKVRYSRLRLTYLVLIGPLHNPFLNAKI